MNFQDAICEGDFGGREYRPTYYCETCGKELHHPTESGCCQECDDKRDEFEINTNDPRR